MNGIFRQERNRTRTWGEIAADLFDVLKNNLEVSMREKRAQVGKRIAAFVLMIIGSIFFLNGLAVFVGNLINETAWSGYLATGIVLILIAILIPKR